jgi:DnaJ family protein C protein 7
MQAEQARPGYHRRWWQDGEYDAGRADVANGAGLVAHAAGAHADAFEAFTEAIRLAPREAQYHANRAAAALRLGRAGVAAEDAEQAAALDAGSARARLRAGRARLALGDAAAAAAHFERAQELGPASAAAARGLEEARALSAKQAAAQERERTAADAAVRPPLTRGAVEAEAAALQLLAADAMLEANPRLEAARAARVEGLILCSRTTDALAACEALLESAERRCLEAEALWRGGDVAAALGRLAAPGKASAAKLRELATFLKPLGAALEAIDALLEEGRMRDAAEAATAALAGLTPSACPGLGATLLRRRAAAAAGRRRFDDARADLAAALALSPGDAAALLQRAELHAEAGDHVERFLDLQHLKKVAPGTPGLAGMVEAAARAAGRGARSTTDAVGGARPAAASALAALGLPAGASAAGVRRAYLRAAAAWHPDKWGQAGAEERAAAEERFKAVQAAYEELTAA